MLSYSYSASSLDTIFVQLLPVVVRLRANARIGLRQPSYLGLPYRNIEVITSDNIRLRCYLIERTPTSTAPTTTLWTPPTTSTPSATSATSGTPDVAAISMRNAKAAYHYKHSSSSWDTNHKPRATVLMFHGNGMDHSDFLHHAKHYFRYGCNVLTVSYRGYGESEGMPSEKGMWINWVCIVYVSDECFMWYFRRTAEGCTGCVRFCLEWL